MSSMPNFRHLIDQGYCYTGSTRMQTKIMATTNKPYSGTGTEGVTTTPEDAHAMPWKTLKKMMIDKYCPRGEIKKIEFEMWNLKVKGTDVVTYDRFTGFKELALVCSSDVSEESDRLRTKRKLDTTTKLNKQLSRGRMWFKLTPLDWLMEG
ncbi:hypothetical protein Tco_0368491 [Tanacetum coccineum]